MGVGLGGVAGDGLGASDVANLLTHASLPSSSWTRNQSPLTSRIVNGVPFFTFPMTLCLVPGPSRRFTEVHTTFVTRRGGSGVTFGVGEGGGREGFAGETVSGFDGGFAEGPSLLGCSVVGSAEGAGFAAGFVHEQPNKKNRAEINIRTFGMEPLDKYFMNSPFLFDSPQWVFLVRS